MRRLFVGTLLSLLITLPAQAAPWWRAHFTKGDGATTDNTQLEQWMAYAVNQGVDATDTVYVASYTWDGGNIGTIDGLAAANTVGLNAVSAAGGMPSYLIADGDGGAGLTNAQTLSDANVTDVTEAAGGAIMHIKDILVVNKGYTIFSGNHTSGGFNSQNNNAIYFTWSGMSTGMRAKAVEQMQEMAAGTFHDATQYAGGDVFYSPYGDTVELRYSPEDNDGTTAAGTGSLLGRLRQLAQGANESIFFMSDDWTGGAGQVALKDDILASPVVVRGVGGDVAFWDATVRADMEGDANGTLRDEAGAFNRLHSKTFIFDMEWVATGSANMTASATYSTGSNDEVCVLINDFRLARRFMNHYHRVMSLATADPSADAYDNTAPAGATGLGITATDTAFYASWTASATTDVSRYYLFIDTVALTQQAIGDRVDNDGDSYVDENIRGDHSGFAAGTDSWLYPEVMKKGRASTSASITTRNVGDSLVAGVNYYFAIVSVDTQGNEGAIATAGPFMLSAFTDTSIFISKNSDTNSANVMLGETNIVVSSIFIKGDTTTTGDTLTVFAVRNNGSADTGDVTVKLWRDENRDSKISTGDSLVATLTRFTAATRQFDSSIVNDSRSYLGAGATVGRNFLVSIDISPTATIGDTFQLLIAAQTCDAMRWDTGPDAQVLNAGIFTIVSANQVAVAKRGDTPSESVAVNDTRVVMTLRVSVTTPNDTLTAVGIRNLGTMVSGDVARLAIYEDAGADSVLTTADTFIKNLTVNGSIWRDTTISRSFTGTSINLLVVLVTSSGATGLRTFQAEVPIREVDTLNGDSGPTALVTTTAVFTVPSDTGPDTAVRLNEFIPDPNGQNWDNDGSTIDIDEEFVELYNNSDLNVDISGWKYDADFSVGNNVVLPTLSPLRAREFCLIRRDTSGVNNVLIYDSTGISIRDSGIWTGTAADLANTNDTCVISNASNTIIDSYFYPVGGFVAGRSNSREFDGADTWRTGARITPGKNSDPTANMNNASPNAKFTVIATPTTVSEGVNFTIAVTAKNSDDSTIATFYRTAVLRSDSGTIAPSITGSFASGIRSESISISNVSASGSRVVTVAYNSTTSGTVAVQINNLATVTATINLEARADESSCTGTLSNGVDTYIAVSNASGTIVFSAVASGTYQLATKENHHLKRVVTGIVIAGTDSTVTVGLHRAGDANDDNRINIFDGAIVKFFKIFGTGVTADIDGNAAVNDADLAWVRNNFGRVGE